MGTAASVYLVHQQFLASLRIVRQRAALSGSVSDIQPFGSATCFWTQTEHSPVGMSRAEWVDAIGTRLVSIFSGLRQDHSRPMKDKVAFATMRTLPSDRWAALVRKADRRRSKLRSVNGANPPVSCIGGDAVVQLRSAPGVTYVKTSTLCVVRPAMFKAPTTSSRTST